MSTGRSVGEEWGQSVEDPVELTYRHANPEAGNESVLLRFGYENCAERACLLVDAGKGVDLESLLGSNDRLVGICLSHAHVDHYWSLSSCLDDDVPVFTSPDTAAILEEVVDVAIEELGLQRSGHLSDALQPVTEWTTVAPGVELHPVPAGHTPGAVGFLVRFTDEAGDHDILVTGDFTLEACAGYPGFDPEMAADVEALFLTGATADDPGASLTPALGDALERSLAGGRTLVTASALVGVQFATLLTAVADELDREIRIRLVGQTAKLYESLEYDHQNVESVAVFDDPYSCLHPGTITIAGPEVPREDSSYRLFSELKHDAEAGVVQLITGGSSPVTTGGCITTAYEFSMHPTESVLRSVVEALEPHQTVVTHRRRTPSAWNDWPTCVWSPGDDDDYTLYRDSSWKRPPWMTSIRRRDMSGTTRLGTIAGDPFSNLSLPELERAERPTLAEEGVDVDALRDRLVSPEPSAERPDHTATEDDPADATAAEPMSQTEPLNRRIDRRLYETSRPQIEPIDEVPEGYRTRLPESPDIVSARARRRLFCETDEREATESETAEPTTETEAESATEIDSEIGTGTESETSTDTADSDRDVDETDADVEESLAIDESGVEAEEQFDTDGTTTETDSDDSMVADTSAPAATHETVRFELNPLLHALLQRRLDTQAGDGAVESFVADAVEEYLASLIRDGVDQTDSPAMKLHLEMPTLLEPLLDGALEEVGVDGVDEALSAGLASLLGADPSQMESIALGRWGVLLDAALDRHGDVFDSRDDIVESAIMRALDEE